MTTTTHTADWVRTIRDLARRANLPNVLDALEREAAGLQRDGAIHVVITGGANSGKSACINALLGKPLLPVSSLRSTAAITVHAGESERLMIDGQQQPFTALAPASRQASAAEVFIADEWLQATGIRLFERLLDANDDTLGEAIKTILRGADLTVLLIDALMPMTRADCALLNECTRRGLPLIVTISKAEGLTDEERGYVAEYTQQHVIDAGIEVTPINRLREGIEALLASIDPSAIRTRQRKEALLDVLGLLELAAHAGVDAQTMSITQRADEMKKREQRLEAQNLLWMQIEQRLNIRRQKIDEQVREYLSTNRASTLEALLHELERSVDVRQWWARDLPYRLQRELRAITGQISASIGRQVANDVRWLQEELHRQFKYPLSAPLAEPAVEIDEINVTPPAVPLADMQKLRLVSRLGTAATVILAGVTLAQAGIAGATIAISSLGGIAADYIAQRKAANDRSAVRMELDRVVQRAWLDHAARVSAKLKQGYEDLVLALRMEQDRWNQSQVQALRATPSAKAPNVEWASIFEQTQTLAMTIGMEN